ncbi:uncharacterized protein LOC105693649 [Athalia rosae]|uniref:uncharacterized protein LOC105693649 n=1 Tax=Athalia rosae TaxID=37344 RepID=UPI002033628B|nr:uncharacterized protein LOC105693649 [Athalia rosae]XP_020712424.2 uncharacterized protein LOC105693649 [Athalia rosae]XP_048512612.1 uncharacterized protein LOC105693649 [Athalia rosae]XP_048512613.1 uncharacterized protein LOC105693649 [Athalia rosae]XP_048512614.1 uncharacterized protein LOC105693649 [Athalia rosae]XP_048512615.1 uncharacterized protein LOC105693649 [Athalia rosae]XP_048512616.1 uncharacterized protein LOC105693649 [Athalia rosae]XP_048512617.1 uncharacterized protein 
MRRQSFASGMGSGSGPGEPLIVVEESLLGEEEAERRRNESPPRCVDPDSPSVNPYLLSPWRETRKHSLPTPQCTSGITASQVRRLSERGEGSGPTPREAAFLATLSQAPAPQPGGRRHSVVTISKVTPSLFGRDRRESIAAFPMGATRILPSRRDSTSSMGVPPSNSGSTHNLQLDIMDDIADKKPKKVRLTMWKTPSRERVCEVQPLEGSTSPQRYTQQQRRYSDFSLIGGGFPPPSGSIRRRASEMPKLPAASSSSGMTAAAGIVCSNTDLISILSSLTSSASEINRCGVEDGPSTSKAGSASAGGAEKVFPEASTSAKTIEQRRNRLKGFRSNSFDVSILHGTDNKNPGATSPKNSNAPNSWFIKRHQPMSKKQKSEDAAPMSSLTFKDEKSTLNKISDQLQNKSKAPLAKEPSAGPANPGTRHKVVWDDKSGTQVDAQVLGSVIEDFLTSQRGSETETPASSSKPAGASSTKPRASPSKVATWFSGTNKEEEQTESCESSICSTLKDLFVK